MRPRRTWLLLVSLLLPTIGRSQADSATTPDPFLRAIEAELDSMYGPLVYLMRPEQRGVYPSLSVAGKRQFLRRFWAERDPTRGTPRNEAEEAFNKRIAVVNRKFHERGEGGGGVPGWRTDRGRIYLEYGPPDITLSRRGPGRTPPFEVWKYTRGKPRKYCFVDVTRFGNYALVYSTDPREPSRPDWRQLLDDQAYEETLRF